ncbi:MAG: dihydrodipicolinate synthase family protein [Bacteroidetes bacterium]|nr:dihydrodipicolinate synthase family protein [Bacteroidota bacterium]
MNFKLKNGVWPTMVTPFTNTGIIDWHGLENLIEWYISKGVNGVFAVCQSSEMFYLTLQERVALSTFIVEKVRSRCGVVASGHISDSIEDQVEEINSMAATGVEAVVMVANRLAGQDEDEHVWIAQMEKILRKITSEIPLGLYECPNPYKRVLTDLEIKWVAESGRFYFLKDTSSDSRVHKKRVDLCCNTPMKLYNANSATLASSICMGYNGFSGIMGNFHPELYSLLLKSIEKKIRYDNLFNFLGFSSIIEHQAYPVNAKYYLSLEGVPINLFSKSLNADFLSESMKLEIKQFRDFSQGLIEKFSKDYMHAIQNA